MMSVADEVIADYWIWFDTLPKRLYPTPPNGSFHMESLKELDGLLTEARRSTPYTFEAAAREAEAQAELLTQALLEEQAKSARLEREIEAQTLGEYNKYNQ